MPVKSLLDQKTLAANSNLIDKKYWTARLPQPELHSYFDNQHDLKNIGISELQIDVPEILTELLYTLTNSDKGQHIVLLSALNILANKYSSKSNTIIFSPVYKDIVTDNTVNQLVPFMANEFSLDFKSFLNTSRKNLLNDIKHSNYPIEKILQLSQNEISGTPIVGLLIEELQDVSTLKEIGADLIFSFSLENDLSLNVIFDSSKFDNKQIVNLSDLYFNTLLRLLENVDTLISEVEIISDKDKHTLLSEFNNTKRDFPGDKTIIDLFLEQVKLSPDKEAVRFENESLTYKELDQKSNEIAQYIHDHIDKPSAIIGVKLERSLALISSIYGILKSGCVYLPVSSSHPKDRIEYILENSKCDLLITDSAHLDDHVDSVKCVDVNTISIASSKIINFSKPENSAYVIYTSGSTGTPKGVIIRHISLVNRLWWMQREYELQDHDIILQKTPIVFDVSIWELFWWSFTGAKLVLAPAGVEKDPGQLSQMIDNYGITVMHFVPSMLNAFLSYLQSASHDHNLKSIKQLFASGEELSAADAKLFLSICPSSRLHNLYGPTEATVDVSYYELKPDFDGRTVPIGKPIDNTKLLILNKQGQLQPFGVTGELHIGGINLAVGYLNRPELTNEKFIQNPLDTSERLYKTGDLARWNKNGEIEFLGRIDNQTKIRGNRIELGEIENVIQSLDQIDRAIVLVKKSNVGLKLVAFVVSNSAIDHKDILSFLSTKLPDYMLPADTIFIEGVPLTVNGKLDRKLLLAMESPMKHEYKAPETDVEIKLAEIWSQVLEVDKIGVTDNYFALGGDSILAIKVIAILNKRLTVNIEIADLYDNQNIKDLALFLSTFDSSQDKTYYDEANAEIAIFHEDYMAKNPDPNIEAVYPMSSIEKGMCFAQLKNPEDTLYYEQLLWPATYSNFDLKLLEKAVALLIEKQKALRTGLDMDMFAHVVFKNIELNIPFTDISHLSLEDKKRYVKLDMEKSRARKFELSKAPLWKMGVYKIEEDNHLILFEIHHAISDGWSIITFEKELYDTYKQLKQNVGYKLPPLKSAYGDYILEEIVYKKRNNALSYWQKELSDFKKVSFGQNSTQRHYKYERIDFEEDLLRKLNKIAEKRNGPVKNLFFAAYLYAIKMLTYSNDLVVGLVTFNRAFGDDTENIFGNFLNTIPFRMKFDKVMSITEILNVVDQKLVENKRYDRASLYDINKLIGGNNHEANPISDLLFNFTSFYSGVEVNLEEAEIENKELLGLDNFIRGNTLFDVSISASEGFGFFDYTYSTSFISEDKFRKFHQYFCYILNLIAKEHEGILTSDVILSEEEVNEQLVDFNQTNKELPEVSTIINQFQQAVELFADKKAIMTKNSSMTYAELDAKSTSLAQYIVGSGVPAKSVICVLMERSEEMMVAIYGILKARCAYLPVDPNFPKERIEFMMEDSQTVLILSKDEHEELISDFENVLSLDDSKAYDDFNNIKLDVVRNEDNAYVIYTSGSTGEPKGVIIEHQSVINRLIWMQSMYPIGEKDVILQKTPITFDVSVWELFWGLFYGSSVALLAPGAEKEPQKIVETIEQLGVTTMHFVPSMLNIFLSSNVLSEFEEDSLSTLKYVFCSGEALKPEQVNLFNQLMRSKGTKLVNLYGPTEATVDVSYFDCSSENQLTMVPIGKPIDNTKLYVLDESFELLPIGTIGQLCIAGVGLAKGYLNREDLTNEKFIKNPYEENGRLYLTGDLARWMPDGNIEYLGRMDGQVKIRGFRIELGEIENKLLLFKEIKDVAVVPKEKKGTQYLTAYYVANNKIESNVLKEYLANSLPAYMIPTYFVNLEAMPLTNSGKVNRKELDKLLDRSFEGKEDYKQPSSETEVKLSEVWCRVLGFERISIDENFFDVGGDSLNIITLTNEVHKEFNVELSLQDVFMKSSIELMAEFIDVNLWLNKEQEDDENTKKIEITI